MSQLQTIARPYAKAIFALVGDDDEKRAHWQAFLSAGAAMIQNDEVFQNIKSRTFVETLLEWLDQWFAKSGQMAPSAEERRLIELLSAHNRLSILPELQAGFAALCAERQNLVEVKVRSAHELSAETRATLSACIEKKIKKTVVLKVQVDSSLLAGVIVEYDGQIIDQSIKGRLEKFARELED